MSEQRFDGGSTLERSSTVRLGLVDSQEVLARGLQQACAETPDIELARAASSVEELLASREEIDIALLDLDLRNETSPVRNAATLIAAGIRVIAYGRLDKPYLIRSVSVTDISGFIRSTDPVSVQFDTIRRVARGEALVSNVWANATSTDPLLDEAGLSSQEQRVLTLFASGVKAQTVAFRLGISAGTVDDYVRRIRAKYARIRRSAPTKVDLYKRALEDGYLPLPSMFPGPALAVPASSLAAQRAQSQRSTVRSTPVQ